MKSPLDGLGVLLLEMDDAEFVGPPKPESRQLVGTVLGGQSFTACIAMLQLNRMAMENLPNPREMVIVITTEEARSRERADALVVEDFWDGHKELVASLLNEPIRPDILLPREKEDRLAPQLAKHGPKGYKSAARLRQDMAKLPNRRRR
jgi:hypothetical protein